jgi:hypothetical protein
MTTAIAIHGPSARTSFGCFESTLMRHSVSGLDTNCKGRADQMKFLFALADGDSIRPDFS